MRWRLFTAAASTAAVGAGLLPWALLDRRDHEVTLIHIGDIHGHLLPHADVRVAAPGTVGGLARVYTVVREIRSRSTASLLVNTGDALQGSAEALFTRGEAVVAVMNHFGIDASVPGNWDYLYGPRQFRRIFAESASVPPLANWHALAANLHSTNRGAGDEPCPVLPPFLIREVGGVRVGIIGLTTKRGIRVGLAATRDFLFDDGESALARLVPLLRNARGVDLVVVASELELANNVRLAERIPGIDVVLSADMHERTTQPIVASTGTLLVEEGQDGSAVGELVLTVRRRRLAGWRFFSHSVTDRIAEDRAIRAVVDSVRAPLLDRRTLGPLRDPISGEPPLGALDDVVGFTEMPLHREGFLGDSEPAVLEGSTHDLLADAIRREAPADVAVLRGFRFGTEIRPGPIRVADLYYLMPIGARIGTAHGVTGAQLAAEIERALDGVFAPDPRRWTGGWMYAYSGLTFDVDAYAQAGHRARNVRVGGEPLDTLGRRTYSVSGFWYPDDPATVAGCGCRDADVAVMHPAEGEPMDAVHVVASYLASLPGRTVRSVPRRLRLLRPLPPQPLGFEVIQPFVWPSAPREGGH